MSTFGGNLFVGIFKLLALVAGLGESSLPVSGLELSTCDTPVWEAEPAKLSGGNYGAEISAICTIRPSMGGDFAKLEAYALSQFRQRGAITVGPVDESFEALPSKYLEIEVQQAGKDFSARIINDVHLATDLTERLTMVSRSKKIVATGYAEYVKRIDTRMSFVATTVLGEHRAKITVLGEVSKPWFVPEGTLLSEARKRGPAEYAKVVLKLAQDLEKNY